MQEVFYVLMNDYNDLEHSQLIDDHLFLLEYYLAIDENIV
jgi:hypothetical protein